MIISQTNSKEIEYIDGQWKYSDTEETISNEFPEENGTETTCIDRIKHLVIGFTAGLVTGFSLMGMLVTLFVRR